MRLELLERYSEGDGPLHRLDPRAKLVVAGLYVLIVVATPLWAWRLLAAEGLALAFAVGLSGVPPLALLGRWLGFLVLVGFLAVMVALTHPLRDQLGTAPVVLAIVAKNSLAFLAVLVLANVTPFRRLLAAIGRLGAPPVLVATLQFMYRYVYVLTDE